MGETEKNENNKKSQPDNPNDNDIFENLNDLDELDSIVKEISTPLDTPSPSSTDSDSFFDKCSDCGSELIGGECLSCAQREEKEGEIAEKRKEYFEEDSYNEWRSEMKSKGELNLFGIFSVVVASIYLIYIAFPEVVSILTSEFVLERFILYFILLIIGIGALFGGFVMARHVIIYSRLFDTTFEKEIYSRLEPAFAEVGNVKADLHEMSERMERMNLNITRLEKETKNATTMGAVAVGTNGTVRYMFLMVLSLGVFFFVLRYPGDFVPYALTAMFLVWWAGITGDFRIWKVSMAWSWAFFAVIVIPITAILVDIIYGIGFTTGMIGIALTLFALSYYTWARYYVEGTTLDVLPFLGDEE
jgi:hypothetical protein